MATERGVPARPALDGVRRALRTVVEGLGTRTGLAAAARLLRPDRVTIVAYHNVVSPGEAGRGDASLHLPLPAFLEQVERLGRTHEIVDLETAGDGTRGGAPRAVITFDDAYRGAVTLALPELVRRRLPATVFASPGLLGARGTWWDELGEAGLLTPDNRAVALHELQGSAPAVRRAFLRDRRPPRLPSSYGIATREELLEHAGSGISVGSHAWGHEHLPGLADPEVARTLSRALEWVLELEQVGCPWLALPYGAGSRALGERAVELGYEGVLGITGGRWSPDGDRSLVPRINVPAGLSPAGLELRASGLRR